MEHRDRHALEHLPLRRRQLVSVLVLRTQLASHTPPHRSATRSVLCFRDAFLCRKLLGSLSGAAAPALTLGSSACERPQKFAAKEGVPFPQTCSSSADAYMQNATITAWPFGGVLRSLSFWWSSPSSASSRRSSWPPSIPRSRKDGMPTAPPTPAIFKMRSNSTTSPAIATRTA